MDYRSHRVLVTCRGKPLSVATTTAAAAIQPDSYCSLAHRLTALVPVRRQMEAFALTTKPSGPHGSL
jgi:hypothetical protein